MAREFRSCKHTYCISYIGTVTDYLASEQVISTDARRDKNNKGYGSQRGRSSSTAGRGIAPGLGRGYQGR
eukprot:scaffold3163_cov60-Attheya_sp.AAC.13